MTEYDIILYTNSNKDQVLCYQNGLFFEDEKPGRQNQYILLDNPRLPIGIWRSNISAHMRSGCLTKIERRGNGQIETADAYIRRCDGNTILIAVSGKWK